MAESHPFNNRNFYGATKIAGEQMLRALHTQRGLHYTALRYANVYGPRQSSKNEFVGVVQRMFDRAEAGEPIQISGDGSQAFDFVYVEDVARANVQAMKAFWPTIWPDGSPAGGEESTLADDQCFNVGTGVATSVRGLAGKMADMLCLSHVQIEHVPQDKPGLVKRRVLDCTKAKDALGWQAKVSLDEGLRLYHEWRRGNAQDPDQQAHS